jgi:hypothetical protein
VVAEHPEEQETGGEEENAQVRPSSAAQTSTEGGATKAPSDAPPAYGLVISYRGIRFSL